MPVSLTQFAFNVVRQGISANEGFRQLQAAGLGVRRSTWLKQVGEVRAHYGNRLSELDKAQNRRPRKSETTQIPTKTARGFRQYADIWVRSKGDDRPTVVSRALMTDRLLSRQQVIDILVEKERNAVIRAASTPAPFGTPLDRVVLGGMYTATLAMTPEDEM